MDSTAVRAAGDSRHPKSHGIALTAIGPFLPAIGSV